MIKKSLPAIVTSALPSVVSIIATKHLSQIEKSPPPELAPLLKPQVKIKNKITLKDLANQKGEIELGGGSGFIVDESGIIITNRHVIADKTADYTVITNNNQKFTGEVIARDPINDIAILRLHLNSETKGKITKFPPLPLSNAFNLRLGEEVIAIGNSLGLFRNTVSRGIISGLSRSISAQIDKDSPIQEMRGLIQTDAAINPGNSGGPLLNRQGKVIGINTATISGAQNIGFALPINNAIRDLSDLTTYGHIRRPLLGIRYIIITDYLQSKMNLPINYGALIIQEDRHTPGIIKNSPAAQAKLKEKDIIIEINQKKISSDYNIQDVLEEYNIGDKLKLKVRRNAKILNKTLTLAERK